jgi:hypothetical protein
MNTHVYLAKKLIELGDKSNNKIIKLLAYHRALEEYILASLINSGIKEEYPKIIEIMLNKIKEDSNLYEIYSYIIDQMFNYILNDEIDESIYNKIKELIINLSDYTISS